MPQRGPCRRLRPKAAKRSSAGAKARRPAPAGFCDPGGNRPEAPRVVPRDGSIRPSTCTSRMPAGVASSFSPGRKSPIVCCVTAGLRWISSAMVGAHEMISAAELRNEAFTSARHPSAAWPQSPSRRTRRPPRCLHSAPRACIASAAGFRICVRYRPSRRSGHPMRG